MSCKTRWLAAAILAGLGGPAAAQEVLTHREILGPKGLPGAKSIFAHMDQVVFTRDGTRMAAGAGANVFVWNVADGKEVVRMQLPDRQIYHRLRFTEDGKTLVWCGREDPMIRFFDVATGRQVRERPQPNARSPRGEGFSSRFQAFSPDGKLMAFNGQSYWEGLDIFDVATGKLLVAIKEQKDCRGCAFSPDNRLIAIQSGNGGLHLWDAGTGKLLRQLCADDPSHGGAYKFVTFSPDGKLLASGGHTREALDVWSLTTGKLLCSVPSRNYFYSVAFATDGQSLVCVEADGKPYLYHLLAEKIIHRFDPPGRLCHFVTFSPDCKQVALIGEPTARDMELRQEAIFLYDLPARLLNPAAAQVDDAPLETLFADLSSDNELRLQRIQQAFRAAPAPTVELFRKMIPPITKERQAKVEERIMKLDDPTFATREQAMKDLTEVAHVFAPLLQERQKQAPAGEVRNRLTFVLRQMAAEPQPEDLVRELRAVALLEALANPEAVKLLTELADGAPLALLTVQAREARGRLARGGAPEK